jgi:acetolactate synthase-1/3 small subunit
MIQPVTFLVWTENSPTALLRLATIFTRRRVNIESLTVSQSETVGMSRFTIVARLSHVVAATVGRQIERLIEVRRVLVSTDVELVHREVALVRARISEEKERDLMSKLSEVKVLQRSSTGVLLEVSGTESHVSSVLQELRDTSLTEFVRL